MCVPHMCLLFCTPLHTAPPSSYKSLLPVKYYKKGVALVSSLLLVATQVNVRNPYHQMFPPSSAKSVLSYFTAIRYLHACVCACVYVNAYIYVGKYIAGAQVGMHVNFVYSFECPVSLSALRPPLPALGDCVHTRMSITLVVLPLRPILITARFFVISLNFCRFLSYSHTFTVVLYHCIRLRRRRHAPFCCSGSGGVCVMCVNYYYILTLKLLHFKCERGGYG